MRRVELKPFADLDGFRCAVRTLIAADVAPDQVIWTTEAGDLFAAAPVADAAPVALPREIAALIQAVVCHSDPARYALLYTLIWRVRAGEKALLEIGSDPLVHKLAMMRKAVGRDIHKMHAFLRFRRVEDEAGERFLAWFEPEHFIVEAAAPFFAERFPSMHWSILTPVGSAHWDQHKLSFGPPASRAEAPESDAVEGAWTAYYESTFNPARVNPDLMRQHMPKKYWRNLPETRGAAEMIRSAGSRVQTMIEEAPAMPRKRDPEKAVAKMAEQEPQTLDALNKIIKAAPPLVPGATQAVLGEGPIGAAIAFVGEQPGDQEDLQGRPFVGPAGQLLDAALAEAGIDRKRAYVTNAVKHFKYEQRGKRRLHKSPTAGEVRHYRWWLMKELELVHPRLVVALGATAVLALAGKPLPIARNRGPYAFAGDLPGFITVHPSFLLRAPEEDKAAERAKFVADLKQIRALAAPLDETPWRHAAE